MMPEQILEEKIETLCGLGKGSACCSYLGMGPNGWVCLKTTQWSKEAIDHKRSRQIMVAMGDNCKGAPGYEL